LKAGMAAVLALIALMAGAGVAACILLPVADDPVWAPRPFPPGWAEQHQDPVAEQVALADERPGADEAPRKQVFVPPKPRAEYRAHYERSGQQLTEKGADLELFGLDADQGVRFEPAGVRIALPPGYPDERPRTGIATTFGLQGDFDIALSYVILHE